MTAPNPVTTLAKQWFEIEGIKTDRRAYGFIGKLYKQYGEETLLQAFEAIRNRPTQAKDIKRPQEYLRGICRKIGIADSAIDQKGRGQFENMMKDVFS